MAFFSKLKDRLFKTSSRLEEGLDAIVTDGGAEDPARPGQAPEGVPGDTPQELPVSSQELLQ